VEWLQKKQAQEKTGKGASHIAQVQPEVTSTEETTNGCQTHKTTTQAIASVTIPEATDKTSPFESINPPIASAASTKPLDGVNAVSSSETKVSATDVMPKNKALKRKLLRKYADDTILYVILALLLPPLAVFLYEGQNWTDRCTLNLILTILCWIPGVVHALLVILDNR
jgi:uncharacterized membrane protein YqaE (UPF0057 family)